MAKVRWSKNSRISPTLASKEDLLVSSLLNFFSCRRQRIETADNLKGYVYV